MTPLITVQNASYHYNPGKKVLEGVSFDLIKGTKTAVVGANGAGKSTLLLMLNGMIRPQSGEIRVHGEPIRYKRNELREIRRLIGYVFQDSDRQIIAPEVWQDVAFGPANLGFTGEVLQEKVGNALSLVGLDGFDRRAPYQLSGGEKKRVAIAGVLAMDPEVLVLDEPTSTLDPAGSEDLMELLDELNHQGKTIIISTHDVELAYPWADSIILMDRGRIIAEGPPGEAFVNRELIRQARLKIPVLLDLCQELQKRGMNCNDMPKTVLDMIRLIEYSHHGSMRLQTHNCGIIHVADIAEMTHERIASCMKGEEVKAVGAMGSQAKICARHWGITPDYTYAVIDKCILHAMNGRSSLILTSGGMVDRVVERVATFNRENNRSIRLEALHRRTNQVPADTRQNSNPF